MTIREVTHTSTLYCLFYILLKTYARIIIYHPSIPLIIPEKTLTKSRFCQYKALDIFYKDVKESVIETRVEKFYIDKYGNYFPIESVLFGGYLGRQRLGDVLPLDYGIVDN